MKCRKQNNSFNKTKVTKCPSKHRESHPSVLLCEYSAKGPDMFLIKTLGTTGKRILHKYQVCH